jgi:D-alanyl-D-alanine carboxypeptidase
VSIALARPDHLPPGQAWRYCNTDYVLLGLIVQAVTGKTLDQILAGRCSRPWA